MAFLFGAGYGSRTRLLGLGSRCTTDVRILHMKFSLPCSARQIREYSGSCAASVSLRIFFWLCQKLRRCAPHHLAMAKCLWSPPPPRMPKPMYYRCTNPASAYSFSRGSILSSRGAFCNRFVSIRRKKGPSAVLPRELFCL